MQDDEDIRIFQPLAGLLETNKKPISPHQNTGMVVPFTEGFVRGNMLANFRHSTLSIQHSHIATRRQPSVQVGRPGL